jgi:pimeloyl-ACP methyl ester carboxylesterase
MRTLSPEVARRAVTLDADGVPLEGDLEFPENPAGLVLFAHGSGSSRRSPRNRRVAADLRAAGLGTLLFDLLTAEEERVDAITAELRFDIPRLARRLIGAVDWVGAALGEAAPPIGCFGASTGAAAALIAAADRPERVRAVVSRGGRPDLAGPALARVRAPTLLVVGQRDLEVVELNAAAMRVMTCPVELALVPRATHLFEEPGTLDEVAALAARWFRRHLGTADSPPLERS